jgi:hypothetical protein
MPALELSLAGVRAAGAVFLAISSGCIRSDVPPLLPYQERW